MLKSLEFPQNFKVILYNNESDLKRLGYEYRFAYIVDNQLTNYLVFKPDSLIFKK